jgi:hypothetical protein
MWLVGAERLDKPFYSSLSKRFALDEERVRKGKQAPVSESSVAMAFNRMASILNSPVRVDAETVHKFRHALSSYAPHVVTVSSSPSACNPGEAIFLLYIIAFNDGSVAPGDRAITTACTPSELPCIQSSTSTGGPRSSVISLINGFAGAHGQIEILRNTEAVLSLVHL